MSDEITRLQAALRNAAPMPDMDAKARALALALQSYDRIQETAAAARPIASPPQRAGVLEGVRQMIAKLTTGPALAASVSAAALVAGAILVMPALLTGPVPGPGLSQGEAPAVRQEAGDSLAKVAPLPETRSEAEAAGAESAAPALAEAQQTTIDEEMATGTVGQLSTDMGAATATGSAEGLVLADEADMPLEAPQASVAGGLAAPPSTPEPQAMNAEADTERFASAAAAEVRLTAEEPVSTFSVDVDTASWAIVRSSLQGGTLPPREAVRVEEMINYFPYDYPAPEADEAPFRPSVTLATTPWNPDTRLLTIGLQGRMPAAADRPPLNLVFLVDTSGSMDEPNKLPLLKQSLRLMLARLRPDDQVAIVSYAGSAGEVLAPTAASESATILDALERLGAGGGTAGESGLRLAYSVAGRMAAEGEITRILLATDGDFNLGIDDPEALKQFVADRRDLGTYLSVLGFGRGNLDDATMQALAQNGNGTAAYIDTLSEAQKVLGDQLAGALFPIADDVKIQIEFNPAEVAEYRLIGYETRALRREDFGNDRIDAGEIGAGHQVTAIYEVTAPGSPALRNQPLRYGTGAEAGAVDRAGIGEIGVLRLRWKAPGESRSALVEMPIPANAVPMTTEAAFAAAIAGAGQLLAGGSYLGGWGWDEAIALAAANRGADPYGYRAEAVGLMRLAQGLSQQP